MNTRKKIRVLVVENQPSMIESLELFFSQSETIEFAGSADSGAACLEFLKKESVDMILMDINMETEDAGIITARKIYQELPFSPKIAFLTAFPEKDYISQAVRMGYSLLDKTCDIPRIMKILEEVYYNHKLIIEVRLA